MADEQEDHLQDINEELYKHNLELAVANKTLSLLRKLYQISLQSLDLTKLSTQVADAIRVDLNMEAVGIFDYNPEEDSLSSLYLSRSERLVEALGDTATLLDKYVISQASKKGVYETVIAKKTFVVVEHYSDVWVDFSEKDKLEAASVSAHLKTLLLYPLVAQDKVLGALLIGLNRSFDTLNKFEKDSINSFIDVVSVAYDKALLYEGLEEANKQLQALDKARAEFITIASHQLRTPPATIKWYLASLSSGDYGEMVPGVKEIIEKAQVTNNGLISLIDDLLNVSRIERGKMEFLFESSDLAEITKPAVDQLVPQALIKGLELVYNPPATALPPIMADREKLRQVINNMIDNAIKYTPKGTVTVSIYEKDESLCVSVKDSGKGIDKEHLASLFEKYNRGKDSAMHSTGLGLGMYLAKVVIEQHKGKIWAESEGVNKGSTFIFSIPINSGVAETTILDLTKE